MQISVSKPDLVRFVQDQVSHGRFSSVDDVVEAALDLLKLEGEDLDSKTLAAIRVSKAQFERGEGQDLREALGNLRRKYESK